MSDEEHFNAPQSFDAAPKAGDPLELEIYGVKAVFRYCPPGTFLMGSPGDEEGRHSNENHHKVALTKGFWLLETPVTQAFWKAVMGENPSIFQGADARPVEYVSWNDCMEFISKLNAAGMAHEGLKFDFPTESEWEYACRAGTTTRFNVGDELTEEDANFNRIVGETTPVKSYAPNAWGFCDMHGNVWEWCKDRWGDYPTGSVTDPQGASSGSPRVIRGGSWIFDPRFCSSTCRGYGAPERLNSDVGFRLALRSAD